MTNGLWSRPIIKWKRNKKEEKKNNMKSNLICSKKFPHKLKNLLWNDAPISRFANRNFQPNAFHILGIVNTQIKRSKIRNLYN